ncbi:MAG: enoyl-CoA hydratase [Pseudomonadota bacterium]
MFMTNTANNVLAAAISVSISAALFAYAIIPASPAVFA